MSISKDEALRIIHQLELVIVQYECLQRTYVDLFNQLARLPVEIPIGHYGPLQSLMGGRDTFHDLLRGYDLDYEKDYLARGKQWITTAKEAIAETDMPPEDIPLD